MYHQHNDNHNIYDNDIQIPRATVHHGQVDLCTTIAAMCCCATLFASLSPYSPNFVYGGIVAIVAIVIICCLATLAMSITGETLLSIFLCGMVAAGVSALFRSQQRGGCCEVPQQHDQNTHYHHR